MQGLSFGKKICSAEVITVYVLTNRELITYRVQIFSSLIDYIKYFQGDANINWHLH